MLNKIAKYLYLDMVKSMKKVFWAWAGIGLVVAAALWWAAVGGFFNRVPVDQNHLVIGVTIFPLADMVTQIGGDRVSVALLIPPGTTEHANDLSPQVLAQMEQAKVLFAIGHGLDDRLVARVKQAYGVPVKIVDRGVTLRDFSLSGAADLSEGEEDEHLDSGTDPHYWLTIPNGIAMARTITDELMSLDPAGRDVYEQNYGRYEKELQSAEASLQRQAASFKQRNFMAMHNAWGYFTRAYGLKLVATYEPTEGREPSLTQLQQLGQMVKRYGITAFYAEPQKSSMAAVSFLQREFGLRILTLDPVGGITPGDSYMAMMQRNMDAIATGL